LRTKESCCARYCCTCPSSKPRPTRSSNPRSFHGSKTTSLVETGYRTTGILRPSTGHGALKNLDHRVARSTVAKVLKHNGIPPAQGRPSSWRTFLRAHWGAIAGADFFTTEVWTPRGLLTYYTLFVIDLRSRRVHVVGSTPN